jgi:hypothetical protein
MLTMGMFIDGINNIFVEKGSLVWYWDGGRWLKLTGAD